MPQLQFYFGPGACSLASHIALEETGAPFTASAVALRKGEQQKPEYLAMNPKGKVPLLVIDGKPLTENVAILTYLSKAFPQAKLLPSGDLLQEAEALSFLAWCTAGIHPVFSRMFGPQRFCDLPDSADNVKTLAAGPTAQNFALIETMLAKTVQAGKDWLFGEFSAADAYLFVFWRWALHHKLDVSAYPNYAKHFERMLARPSVQRAMAREQAAQAEIEKAA